MSDCQGSRASMYFLIENVGEMILAGTLLWLLLIVYVDRILDEGGGDSE